MRCDLMMKHEKFAKRLLLLLACIIGADFAPQDFAHVVLRDNVDEFNASLDAFVRRHLLLDELGNLGLIQVLAGLFHDVSSR